MALVFWSHDLQTPEPPFPHGGTIKGRRSGAVWTNRTAFAPVPYIRCKALVYAHVPYIFYCSGVSCGTASQRHLEACRVYCIVLSKRCVTMMFY